jgi:hypothetical protein
MLPPMHAYMSPIVSFSSKQHVWAWMDVETKQTKDFPSTAMSIAKLIWRERDSRK